MGLNIGAYGNKSIIDAQALARVTEKIFNPENQNSIDVSKLDLTKFNRASLGLDLYAARTNTQTAVQAAKAVSDFDVNLSRAFSANVQYLNSAAAQSLFTSRENTGKIVLHVETAQKSEINEAVSASADVNAASDLKKDRRGSNPFSFYMNRNEKEDTVDLEMPQISAYTGLNIFA